MSDQPKRRGRPPKDRTMDEMQSRVNEIQMRQMDHPSIGEMAERLGRPPKPITVSPTDEQIRAFMPGFLSFIVDGSLPTPRMRVKMQNSASLQGAIIQQAWQHPTGTQWRALPCVGPEAPDWEDGA